MLLSAAVEERLNLSLAEQARQDGFSLSQPSMKEAWHICSTAAQCRDIYGVPER